jgi:hypothetical protein
MRRTLLIALTLLVAGGAGWLTTRLQPGLVAGLVVLAGAVAVLTWPTTTRPRRRLSLRYRLYIRYSPAWKRRARACKERAGWECEHCGASVREAGWLEAHHKNGYAHLYHERPEDLEALCPECHEEE